MSKLVKVIAFIGSLVMVLACFTGCETAPADESIQIKLFSAVPEVAKLNQKVVVYGTNIGTDVIVKIGGLACVVDSVSDVRISFTVPADCIGGALEVSSSNGTCTLKDFLVDTGVLINSFYPQSITINGLLVIKGSGFDVFNPFKNVVSVIDNANVETFPFTVVSVAKDSMVVKATSDFTNGYLKVNSANRVNKSVSQLTFIKLIRLDSFSPNRGGAGTLVTFKGENFTAGTESEYAVKCGGKDFTDLKIIDRNTFTAKIPADMNANDTIRISTINYGNAISKTRLRYDFATEVNFGGYGILYDSQTIPITQGKVDSLLNMGVTYVTLSLSCTLTDGFETGNLPAEKTALDNVVRLKQMSGNKLKTILIIQHNKTLSAGYVNVTPTTIKTLFENIKSHTFNGVSTWDNVDGFQLFYSSGSALALTATGVKDYSDKLLKPVYAMFHPDGYAKRGEKLLVGLQATAIVANTDYFTNLAALNTAEYFENIDIYSFMWNLGTVETSKTYYSRTPQALAFEAQWLNRIDPLMKEKSISFLCEMNFSTANAPYIKVETLEGSFVSIAQLMKQFPTYKGFSYAKFHANDYGIRSATDAIDNRSAANTVVPVITHYQMYKNVVTALK